MPAARARTRCGSICASVSHGPRKPSPVPAWQWQSTIIVLPAPSRDLFLVPAVLPGRDIWSPANLTGSRPPVLPEEPHDGLDAGEEGREAEPLVRTVRVVVRQSEAKQDRC